jgi:D-alanyl-D-alanine carboxypeptidase
LGKNLFVGHGGITHALPILGVALAVMISSLALSAAPANAGTKPRPSVVDAEVLTPYQLTNQVKAAEALRAKLMKSSAQVAVANTRLERLSAQATTLLANLAAARTTEVAAETEAAAQQSHLIELGLAVEGALNALGQLASDSYIRGGGPLGDVVAIFEALTAPSADKNTDSMATVQYLVDARARLFERLESLRSEQVLTSARAEAASQQAAAAAKAAAEAKAKLDTVIAQQRSALEGLQNAQADQVGQAAGLRGALLRSESRLARAADKRLAEALQGQDFKLLMDSSPDCGKDTANYPNGRYPATALCPLYAAPDEGLPRDNAMAFNAMSRAYEQQTGSPLCVTDAYRTFAEQVVVQLATPELAAVPGTSQHGFGLAVDLCGGVQSFATPAHLWMERHAPLYGWFQPAWADSTGVLPEPWHWEFAS